MLSYQVLSAIDRAYGVTMLGVYVFAFVMAFAMIFFFPPGSLILLFLGLFGLILVFPAGLGIHWSTCRLGRHYLRGGRCPGCGESVHVEASVPDHAAWSCPSCDARYTSAGDAIDPRYRPSVP